MMYKAKIVVLVFISNSFAMTSVAMTSIAMTSIDVNKIWLAFISSEIIEKCMEQSRKDCHACSINLASPILHRCHEFGLFDKLKGYMNTVQIDIDSLWDKIVVHFGWFSLDRNPFIQIGNSFVNYSTPEAVFYGKYITHEIDRMFHQTVEHPPLNMATAHPTEVIKPKKKKPRVTSKNDVSGDSRSDNPVGV